MYWTVACGSTVRTTCSMASRASFATLNRSSNEETRWYICKSSWLACVIGNSGGEGGGGVGGGASGGRAGGGGGDAGGVITTAPQSVQSVPRAHTLELAPVRPSSQKPSFV